MPDEFPTLSTIRNDLITTNKPSQTAERLIAARRRSIRVARSMRRDGDARLFWRRNHLLTVSIEVCPSHPLLLLKRALPWDALTEVMTRHWRHHHKNVDGGSGLPWDVSLYVPLVVLMIIKGFDSRQMEAYLAENVVARVFIGRHHDPHAQIRDHSNIARAYAALGKAGIEEVNTLTIQESHRFGFVDEGVLSADTTAQELLIGYPNEPGILRGLAQRVGRALTQLKQRGVMGLEGARDQVQTALVHKSSIGPKHAQIISVAR
jgi:hypothetical protein